MNYIIGSRVYCISNCELNILNVDAACRETPMVGFGGVLGPYPITMHGFHNLLLRRPMGAKALAIYEGLRLAPRLELPHILVLAIL